MGSTIEEGKDSVDTDIYAPEYRDRLRTWLVKMIHSGTIPGLVWENDEKTIFRMPWKHAGRQDYNLEEDSKIFMAWAKHSGRYREGIDKPEPIVWKTRLRCALNKMPDIRELPDRSRLDISEPYRVYQLLPPVHKASQIRRRLYKRSQSQDTERVTSSNNVSPTSSFLGSFERNEESWTKPFLPYRRNNSSETQPLRYNSTSPPQRPAPILTSTSNHLTAPAFWLSQPGGIPFKPPMSTPLPALPLPQTQSDVLDQNPSPLTNFNAINSRYPLLPNLHTPFSSSVPPVFSGSTAFRPNPFGFANPSTMMGHMKQMTAQAIAAEQKYQEQLSFARKLEEENDKLRSDERRLFQRLDVLEKKGNLNADELRRNPAELQRKAGELERELGKVLTLMGRNPEFNKSAECNSLYSKLNESQHRIESLEGELTHYRSAHAREREAREKLEIERERMKSVLEGMGEGLRNLAVHMRPNDVNATSGPENDVIAAQAVVEGKRATFDEFKRQLVTCMTSQAAETCRDGDMYRDSPLSVESRRSSVRSSSPHHDAVQHLKPRSCDDECSGIEENKRKRASSPLDLTVGSPAKIQRTSGDECDSPLPPTYPGQSKSSPPSLLYVTHRYSGEISPDQTSSNSSASPDHVIRSGSLSPPQRSPHRLGIPGPRHGTIQVS